MDTSDIARCERKGRTGARLSSARRSLLCAATLFFSWAFPGLALAQAVSFTPPRDFTVGPNPEWVAVGDFNRDGIQDLAVANSGRASGSAGSVSVLLGNGDGTFQTARDFPAHLNPAGVAVGDFNGDGIEDLVTANYNSDDVSVLLGNGDGTFGPPLNIPVGAGSTPNFVAVGDFNRDGRADLAVANYGGGSSSTAVGVLLGNGNGTFQAPVALTTGRYPLWVEVGDLNGDGLQDLAVANFSADVASVSVLLGNGDGTFQAARNTPVHGAACVAVGDFNGDGVQDLAVIDYYSGNVAVLLGNGDGTSAPAVVYAAGVNALTVTVGDLNGDGVQDLAVANWNQNAGNTVSVLLGNGDGTFQAKQDIVVGRGVAGAVFGDFNGDGASDLVVPSFNGNFVSVLLNTTTHAPNTLTVNKGGTGSGTVTSSPAGIDCGATCSAPYPGGTVVTLTATPAGGSTFSGWSGGGCSGTGSCVVTMNAATTVAATFDVQSQSYSLTVSKTGTGSGTVTSSPAGISCGATCSASYNSGTVVTLTASPAGGSTFAGWSGAGCSGSGSCVVTMSAAASVTATFNVQTFPLSVSKSGTGSGTVTSSPAGINCGAACSASYNYGTSVTLTASPAGGSTFTGWSGACSGTGSCVVSMTAARSVTASFTVQTFTLSVTIEDIVNILGIGSGSVTSSPAGIDCGSGTCSANFDSGTSVTLTPHPGLGSTFAGWSGACSGTGSCTVPMGSNQAVTAKFKLLGVL